MKLFRLTIGNVDMLGVAEDAEDMYERRAEVDHTFEWLPVEINEVLMPGYTITITPDEPQEEAPKRRRK